MLRLHATVMRYQCGPMKELPSCKCPLSPETIRRIVISNIWLIVSLGLALYLPQIKYIISPMGCLAGVFIFVFPGLWHCKLPCTSLGHVVWIMILMPLAIVLLIRIILPATFLYMTLCSVTVALLLYRSLYSQVGSS